PGDHAPVDERSGQKRADWWRRHAAPPIAVRYGYVEVVKALLGAGADLAVRFEGIDQVAAIDVLVDAGVAVSTQTADGGSTPLHVAVARSSRETVLALLKHGAHVNRQTSAGAPALHFAAQQCGRDGPAEMVDLLLRHGADEAPGGDHVNLLVAHKLGDGNVFEDLVFEDLERADGLLKNAPADRVWRRRGYLVMCRA
ncbi:unnamed protein product, partial [Hapterophycus canaliculatus]